jgi:tetratricopeptide (TPR) repeat protein
MAAATKLLTGKRYKDCIEAYRAIGADHPDRWGDCLANMGASYFFLGEFEKAIACYTQAMKHGVDEDLMRDNIAEAREEQTKRN